jgi:hypothetical protein
MVTSGRRRLPLIWKRIIGTAEIKLFVSWKIAPFYPEKHKFTPYTLILYHCLGLELIEEHVLSLE